MYGIGFIFFVFAVVHGALSRGLTNTEGMVDSTPQIPHYSWIGTEEWAVLKEAIAKDAPLLRKAGDVSHVSARLIAANLFVEQMRLYTSHRELFKTLFAPLKLLGSQNQFSWGIMGIKQKTAVRIEEYLKDNNSPFYPGPHYENLLDFTTDNPDEERFERLNNEDDHYWSYLYAGLFLKEIEVSWKTAGFDISHRPEILSTLYNIGFEHSRPNAHPQSGGARITLQGQTLSFGMLAASFYYSDELLDILPR